MRSFTANSHWLLKRLPADPRASLGCGASGHCIPGSANEDMTRKAIDGHAIALPAALHLLPLASLVKDGGKRSSSTRTSEISASAGAKNTFEKRGWADEYSLVTSPRVSQPPADGSAQTRASLLARLRDCDDQSGWQEFFDTYWKLIYGVALKAGLTDSEARDVVQETMVAVVKQMPEFEYNRAAGRFKNWLLTIATRRIIDQLRRQGRMPPTIGRAPEGTDTGTPLLERLPDPALLQAGQTLARLRGVEKRLRFVQRAGALVTAVAAVIAAGWYWQARQTGIVRQLAEEKSQLVDEKTRLAEENQQRALEQTRLANEVGTLAEENRERLVRLSVANGVRLLDEDDPSGALLWFAQALTLVTNRPAEEEIHRVRVQQTLNHLPQPLHVLSHPDGDAIESGAFSPDGRTIATASGREIRLWSVDPGTERDQSIGLPERVGSVRFTPDGRRLIATPEGNWTLDSGAMGFPAPRRIADHTSHTLAA